MFPKAQYLACCYSLKLFSFCEAWYFPRSALLFQRWSIQQRSVSRNASEKEVPRAITAPVTSVREKSYIHVYRLRFIREPWKKKMKTKNFPESLPPNKCVFLMRRHYRGPGGLFRSLKSVVQSFFLSLSLLHSKVCVKNAALSVPAGCSGPKANRV